jgi:hypothetical protein
MSDKAVSRNLTKYVKVGPNQWQHCPVVRGKTGRIRQNLVLVHGRIENHPEGYYSLEWRDNVTASVADSRSARTPRTPNWQLNER